LRVVVKYFQVFGVMPPVIVNVMLLAFLAGCQSLDTPTANLPLTPSPITTDTDDAQPTAFIPGSSPSPASAFLLAERASRDSDMALAADQFTHVLLTDPDNMDLLEMSFRAHYIEGNIDHAAALASRAQQSGQFLAYGSEPALILAFDAQDWSGALVVADGLLEDSATQPMGVVMGAWALALQDQGDAGLTRLKELQTPLKDEWPPAFWTQSALLSEYLSRPMDALEAARRAMDHPNLDTISAMAMAGVMARQGERQEAIILLLPYLGSYLDRDGVLSSLEQGSSPLFEKPSLETLLAKAIIDASGIRTSLPSSESARLHLAKRIAPDFDMINYLLGLYYIDIERHDLARIYHDQIDEASLWHHPTQFIKARFMGAESDEALFREAIGIFDRLVTVDANNPALWMQKGHTARWNGDYDTALNAYNKALSLTPENARLHYYRGLALDQLDQKDAAEAALRQSLALDGGDAYALNYLGYWLLEEGGDAEEALGFIRDAIEKQPDNGYFMDSLGWGYFKLGDLDQALVFMEKAVILRPVDPLITDHLGDVYAALDRWHEAVFQWQRALDLIKEGKTADGLTLEMLTEKIQRARVKSTP
jgi:tetratricopeptide (TPR) repeat protein